jgi:hypothetical protein
VRTNQGGGRASVGLSRGSVGFFPNN